MLQTSGEAYEKQRWEVGLRCALLLVLQPPPALFRIRIQFKQSYSNKMKHTRCGNAVWWQPNSIGYAADVESRCYTQARSAKIRVMIYCCRAYRRMIRTTAVGKRLGIHVRQILNENASNTRTKHSGVHRAQLCLPAPIKLDEKLFASDTNSSIIY